MTTTPDPDRTDPGPATGPRPDAAGPAAPHGSRTGSAGNPSPAGPDPAAAAGQPARTGVWFIGARGSVATTAVTGGAALAAGMHPPTGMVTEMPPFADCGLPPLDGLVFGGHDTNTCPLPKRAEALAAGGVLPHGLPAALRAELAAADAAIRPGGPQRGDTRTDEELITAFAADMTAFTREHGLARTVVVNVASTEPAPAHGKTGQTLLRSVLAPMFLQRALEVRAWSGSNVLGGGDGAALADPAAAAAKNAGKARALTDTLGSAPEGETHIDDVPAMGDWKTAWDHVAFDGFLGTRMFLQTIWQGCDSALAAPLVLDLARLTAAAHAAGTTGPVPGLGFYFKDPDEGPPGLTEQWHALLALAERLRGDA
ncbi:inositol-3-phosphate synthase [Streptomyces sp. Ru87]|uniref:inositol-3-phosphate synthase n=1 Tax=Streptomyces sp. Ru87 TaxID=2044307 RepID=UPI000BF9309E|nr:inositol-3-phosphate synthase [Streptomyces sp. Ru87]PGH47769.1 myo-inositol-1-phosphate synthase [Streptomyces sp. Ru87]